MDSGFQQQHNFEDEKQQVNSLTRFRSAPSSYFASFLDAADTTFINPRDDLSNARGDFSNARPLSPETESIFARFMSRMGDGNNSLSHKSSEIPRTSQMQPEMMVTVKEESDTLHQQQQRNYNTTPQMIYRSASKPPLAIHHSSAPAVSSSIGMNSTPHMKIGIGGCSGSSLTRHSSSPAGFFDTLNIDGYGVMGEMGNYGGGSTSIGQPPSTSGLVKQNSEAKTIRMHSIEETKHSHLRINDDSNYNNGLPKSLWEDSILSETFSNFDGGDDGRKIFSEQNRTNNQTGESKIRPPLLAHQLSLPNTSAELSAMEKLLHLQDGVPLRIRAKRGFATHPRSIAERVRRTKISERMRKLQDLVPNMDKQTNTSDMLDLAVDYIKDLQKQVKNLHGNRTKCTCLR
ncbi:transcription factor bHLH130-like [Silene latifolia]|uniref:transcription factor bHLH130-like n=1 Tax=Silene latifolia TaxID=37657 RepID=UPI003D781194